MKIEKLINLDLLTQFFNNLKTHLVNNLSNSISIEYSDLVTLRDNGELIPGTQYRITDFVTTTTTEKTMSAGHQFDVVVTASSNNTFNEDAKAALHEDATYFANCNIDSWELKYCINNDISRFAWADTSNGKGVIYYMKDNLNNECGYDFKNILFKNPMDTDDNNWYYTFTTVPNEDPSLVSDDTLIERKHCYNNIIKPIASTGSYQLNFIIFTFVAAGNFIDYDCHDIKFGSYAQFNKFGKVCFNNTLGDYCQCNTLGDYCSNNTIGNHCQDNNFETNCKYVVLSNGCYRNTFGIACHNVKLSSENCFDNIFKQNCAYVELITEDDVSLGNIQKYIVDSGASNMDGEFNTYNVKRGLNNETTITKSSKDEVKEFCVADLIDAESGTQVELVDSTNIEYSDYDTLYLVCDRDYSQEYLTIEALEDNFTFSFSNNNIEYKIEGDDTWNSLPAGTTSQTLNAGQRILLKGNCTPGRNGIGQFVSQQKFNAMGNVMSLLFGDEFKDKYDLTGYSFAFSGLFAGKPILNAKNLILPATTLASYCYQYMFQGCTSLTSAPELPATTLASYCYQYMFHGCTSLTAAPELPATTLVSKCYSEMFSGCSNLNYIKAMFTTTPSTSYLNNWVTGVAEKGTFVKNINATWDVIGISGIPEGWNVIEYPCITPAIVNFNDDIPFYYNDGLYTPAKKPISLLSIFDESQIMQLTPERDIEVCILSEGSLIESSYEWKSDMSFNAVIDDLNLYYEDVLIIVK